MNINSGDIIKYKFPEPKEGGMREITGRIEFVTENYILMLSDNNVKVKISFKNFDNITPVSIIPYGNLSERKN